MSDPIRSRLHRIASLTSGAQFAGAVLYQTGFLTALSPSGVLSFVRSARGMRPGSYLALMLHAANKPEKIALVDGSRRYRYTDLDREINQLAHAFADLGVLADDCVAFLLPNCAEYLVAQHAAARLGAISVHIGNRLKGNEIAHILANAEPRLVMFDAALAAVIGDALERIGKVKTPELLVCRAKSNHGVPGVRYEAALAGRNGEHPPKSPEGGGGTIIYTSGTTGQPKGANRDYRRTGLESVGDFFAKIGMRHDDRHLVVCPLYHSAAPAFANMTYTLGGSNVVLEHFEPEKVLDIIARERITSSFMVPTMLHRLAQLSPSVRRKYDTSSLRWILSGAAPLPTATASQFQCSFGRILWNFYGSTETGLITLAGPEDHEARPGTIGRLLRGNQVKLLDARGAEVPPGQVGELYAKNSMLIVGYHRDAAATQKAMVDGFFSVGDLARVDENGYYYLASRKHDMVISGGVNIYPREIEDYLLTHPDIVDAAVLGVPDHEWGESLKAFVVKRAGASLTGDEVIAFCRRGLADYKRPRQVVFRPELPRTPTGKVLKRELRGT